METAQLKTLLERMPAAIAMFDRDMRYLVASENWIDVFELPRPVIGKSHYDIFPDIPDRWRIAHERGLGGEIVQAENDRYERSDGRVFWLRWEIVPWYDDDKVVGGILIFAEDITEWKLLTEKLRDIDRRKDEFLAMLGHELRNPLVPVSYGVELLKSERGKQKERQILDMMSRQLAHLIHLVDDLLEITRINQGKIKLHRTHLDLKRVVADTAEAVSSTIEAAGHRFSISLPAESLPVSADATRVVQVLTNLLNNATKFTPRGGHIELSLRQEGDSAVVSVRDNGSGIPRPMLSKVFDLFAQVDQSGERSPAGLGVGLALVRSLVSLHGGTVEARSEGEGRGSEFIVRFPLEL